MLIIPAIDLKNGKVVRLWQGDFSKEIVYSENPASVARQWEFMGAKLLHLVDLDGALTGSLKNLDIAAEIAKRIAIPVELGGGIRTEEAIEKVLSKGINRVVLGTKIYKDPEFAQKIISKYQDKVIVSIDSKAGLIQANGWTSPISLAPVELAGKIKELGLNSVIYTDISKDGTLSGPDLASIKRFLRESQIKTIVSGGIASLEDITKLNTLKPEGLSGVIIGKALYEGKVDLREAIAAGK
ncbi:MAG: 1-(5-phosphoribosyl)-5-[(5-phosphoribosylamino)methylideneamino]imidazole-4-carboxamide isomerase [Candidatus Omnitrophota bacterium]|nr:1-(5-phosphoribosyl)-5-[(5-phosphoribosylamino)methylideneamino]imidazole-4-carboxamide isomerase [Candidatus Omnitrophota bacterium]